MQRIGLHDTGLCSKCNVPEDVVHYFFSMSKVQSPKVNFEKGIKEIKSQIHTPNFVQSTSDINSFQFS